LPHFHRKKPGQLTTVTYLSVLSTVSAGLTKEAILAIATGPAFVGAPRSSGSKSYLLHYI